MGGDQEGGAVLCRVCVGYVPEHDPEDKFCLLAYKMANTYAEVLQLSETYSEALKPPFSYTGPDDIEAYAADADADAEPTIVDVVKASTDNTFNADSEVSDSLDEAKSNMNQ